MTKITRRTVLVGAGTLAALLAHPRFPSARAEDKPVRAIQPWEITSLQPEENGYVFNRASIAENLVALSPEGKVVPSLALSWKSSANADEWRFKIRQGVLFHDGTTMTTENAKASIERLLPVSSRMKDARVKAVELDGDEIVFKLERPFSPFPGFLCDPATAIYAPAAFGADGKIAKLISTGPFKVESIEMPRLIKLARHDAYWGQRPSVERAEFEAVGNGETRANIALAGDADVVMNIPTPSVSRIASSGVAVSEVINPRVHALYLNCAKPQFSDARARRALSMAIDRTAIATTIMRNKDLAATQLFPPVVPDWYFADLPHHDFDVAGAEALLDETGWTKGSDGIRSKDGVRFAGTLRTFPNRPEMPVIAAALQAMYRTVGFDLAISVGDWTAIPEGRKDGTLDIGFDSRNLVIVPDDIASVASDLMLPTLPGSDGGPAQDEKLRKLIERFLAEPDTQARSGIRREIGEFLQSGMFVVPVVWYSQIVAVSNRVEGFVNDPYEQSLYLERLTLKG